MENINNKIYLDNNATTPLDPEVLEAIYSALKDDWGNPSSAHETGKQAKKTIYEARKNIAEMIGANFDDIIFTSGGTESNNLVIHSVLKNSEQMSSEKCSNKLPHFISTNLEHDSIRLPLEVLVKENRAEVTFVAASKLTGQIQPEDILAALKPTTCLISVMMANNETGVMQPVKEIFEKVRQTCNDTSKIFFHTDAAQCFGKVSVNVDELGVDYLTIVGHKFYGPRIGALYARSPNMKTPLNAIFFGGGQERNFRPGTENTGMIAGLGKAAHLINNNLESYKAHMKHIRDYLEQQLQIEFGNLVRFNCKRDDIPRLPNTSNISFVGDGLYGYKILNTVSHLEASVGAACHAGTHKPSHILLNSGVDETIACNAIRLSVGRNTSEQDIDIVIGDFKQALSVINQS